MVRKNDAKKVLYDNYSAIKIGDVVFSECDGPCSGGARYGVGAKVTKITENRIITEEHSFYLKNGMAASPPTAYYIEFWQKGK